MVASIFLILLYFTMSSIVFSTCSDLFKPAYFVFLYLMQVKPAIAQLIHPKGAIRILLLILSVSCKIAFAQTGISDSLRSILKNAPNDTTRCGILYRMIEDENDVTIWPAYNDLLTELCNKNLAETRPGQAEHKTFLKYYGEAMNNTGYLASSRGDHVHALEYYEKSLKIREEQGDLEGVASSFNNIGFIYKNLGDIPKALEYYEESLKIREKMGEKAGIASTLVNLASIYADQGDEQKSLEYCARSLKLSEGINNKEMMTAALINMAVTYKGLGDTSKALEYFSRALSISEQAGYKDRIAFSLNNIGTIYLDRHDYKNAMDYFNKSLQTAEKSGSKRAIVLVLDNMANVFQQQKKYSTALAYADKSLRLSKEMGYPDCIRDVSRILVSIYKATGNYQKALESYETYVLMRDSVNNKKARESSIKSQLKYGYEKKAAADSVRVAAEKEVVDAQLRQEKTQRRALYGGLALVALFAVFMFNRFRVTRKQKKIIELKEQQTKEQNVIITQQKHIVEEKHKEITDSINYAERIQRSFLATKELLDENLGEYFILFKPKDVVSGDFYWAASRASATQNLFYLCTADSTGHGVPGAIMSLLNITSIEGAIREGHTSPADILNETRKTIIERLKKDGSAEGGKDGMDCSLCVFDFTNMKLYIAAANNPVWIVRKGEGVTPGVVEVKPDKMPVGKHDKQQVSFARQEFDLQKGDVVYTLTDGFPDQFGGSNGKKFMSKNLRELLAANAHLPMQQQKELLESTFKNWISSLEQVDDVTVIGVRIS
jgi:serine phosphatase RsbU (regulator of sigma subunit)/Tfp pilus assembly protein PilF